MRVARLTLRNFRNYEHAEVSLPDGVTVVHGAIAAGKTNFLEAAYFGCLGRSCRTANEHELVKFGERATTVSILTMNGSDEHTLEIGFEPGRRDFRFEADGRDLRRFGSQGRWTCDVCGRIA